MNKVKILYIITKTDVGGAQKYVSDLARNIDRNKFDAKILYGGKDIFWLSNKVRPWFLFANNWLAIFELVRLFKKEKPDIIHLNSSMAGVLGALAAQIYKFTAKESGKNLRVVFTAHGWVFNPTNKLNPVIRLAYLALHKISSYLQDEIICVSEYDYALAKQYGINPRISLHTVHNGIDPDIKFIDKIKARKEILNKLKIQISNFKKDTPWVGSVGRLVKEKNYETYISSALEIIKKYQSEGTKEQIPYFFLIGEGLESEKLKLQILNSKLEERFFIIDPAGDDAKYLKAFDIFVMSSIKEGLPYTLLEAMAAELPIVVTEAGGIPEIIKNHSNGMMVSQKNPKQLAQAISGLLANPSIREELASSAKKAVTDHFNINEMISKTEKIYEKSSK